MSRLTPQAIATFLGQTALLRGCAPDLLAKLSPHVEQIRVERGRLLLAPGTPVAALGVLLTGRATAQLFDASSGSSVALEEVFPGDVYGEVGLAIGGASPISVVAEEECEALLLQKAHLDKLVAHVPDVAQALLRRLGMRVVKVGLLGSRRGGAAPAEASVSMPPPARPSLFAAGPNGKPRVPFVETAEFQITPKLLDMLPTRLILEQRVLPLELRGRTLVVGMVAPASVSAREELGRALHSVDPEYVAISADDFFQTVVRLKLESRTPAGQAASRNVKPVYAAESKKEAEKGQLVIGNEVIALLDRIFVEALERNASDVHIEPEATSVRVRLRIGGLLVDRKEVVPPSFATALVARVKVLAELDITERRLPQDGRIVAQVGKREVNFRVSTLPSARGEKVVVRLLDPSDVMRPLEHIFFDPRASELVQKAVATPHGAIFVAGPAGSGKTSTLYSLLNARRLGRPDENAVSVEDPVEFLFPGVTQTAVNARAGLDWAVVLRALLRQDPDTILVGEIRSPEAAHITIEAALTGHLVLSTLHGTDVAAVMQRMLQFGCDPVLLSQALQVVIVQRLARRLCSACVQADEVAPALLEALAARKILPSGGSPRLPRAVGCEACDRSGFRGRVPVIELLALDEEARAAIARGAPADELIARAAAGGRYLSFVQSAKLLVARGAITPADALFVSS